MIAPAKNARTPWGQRLTTESYCGDHADWSGWAAAKTVATGLGLVAAIAITLAAALAVVAWGVLRLLWALRVLMAVALGTLAFEMLLAKGVL